MRITTIVCAGLLLIGANSNAQDKSFTIDLDGTRIKITAPQDLEQAKTKLKTLANYIDRNTPSNALHELYADKGATDESFRENGLKRNADVQTVKSLNNKMTQEIFTGVKELLTKQFDQMVKKVLADLSKGSEQSIDTIEKGGSGPIVNKQDQFAYLFYSKIKTQDKEILRVSVAGICFVDGNMIMLNVHSNVDSDKDIEWAKETSRKWLAATVAANGEN